MHNWLECLIPSPCPKERGSTAPLCSYAKALPRETFAKWMPAREGEIPREPRRAGQGVRGAADRPHALGMTREIGKTLSFRARM